MFTKILKPEIMRTLLPEGFPADKLSQPRYSDGDREGRLRHHARRRQGRGRRLPARRRRASSR